MELFRVDEVIGAFAESPIVAGDIGGFGAEDVLGVMEEHDGEAAFGVVVVVGREVDGEVALSREDAGVEVAAVVETRGKRFAHGYYLVSHWGQ